jgi:Tol biopolymer transport system component
MMCKKQRLIILAALIISLAMMSCGRKEAGVKKYPLETFYSAYHTYGASFSPEEKFVAYITDRSGKFNIWTVSTQGGEPKQLTNFDDGAMFVTWCRHENSLLFSQDKGGNENFHLYIMPAAGGFGEFQFHGMGA